MIGVSVGGKLTESQNLIISYTNLVVTMLAGFEWHEAVSFLSYAIYITQM